MIRIACTVLLLGGLVACSKDSSVAPQSDVVGIGSPGFAAKGFGAGVRNTPPNSPIGGGYGYSGIVTGGFITVYDYQMLENVLSSSTSTGKTIFIPDGFPFPDNPPLELKWADMTIASDRGHNGGSELGAELSTAFKRKLFRVTANGVRITGLRLRGPALINVYNESGGIDVQAHNVEVDNCEISDFGHFGVGGGVPFNGVTSLDVHHNNIHDNWIDNNQLGYGVQVQGNSSLTIWANVFSGNKHDVVTTGNQFHDVQIHDNIMWDAPSGIPSIDFHGECEPPDETLDPYAYHVGYFNIHHNNLWGTPGAGVGTVYVRGFPLTRSYVRDNLYHYLTQDLVKQVNPDSGCATMPAPGNITETGNVPTYPH